MTTTEFGESATLRPTASVLRLLALLLFCGCSLNPPPESPGRPGIDFEIPAESPPYPEIPTFAKGQPEGSETSPYDRPPRLLKQRPPKFPNWALNRKIEGTVRLEIVISEEGQVVAWRILKSIPALDAEAVKCVRLWKFAPATVGGRPVATVAQAPVAFRIY